MDYQLVDQHNDAEDDRARVDVGRLGLSAGLVNHRLRATIHPRSYGVATVTANDLSRTSERTIASASLELRHT